jgi:hypothetical protein
MKTSQRFSKKSRTAPPAGKPPYQPLPDLSPEEFESLKTDIAENGIRVAVVQDEKGNTLDGHQRERAALEIGLKNFPVTVIAGLSEEKKWEYALSVNIKRRHLTALQKRTLIEQELTRTPSKANQWIADVLGVDLKTVQSVRKTLEANSRIPVLTKLKGRDGRTRTNEWSRVCPRTATEESLTQRPPLGTHAGMPEPKAENFGPTFSR